MTFPPTQYGVSYLEQASVVRTAPAQETYGLQISCVCFSIIVPMERTMQRAKPERPWIS